MKFSIIGTGPGGPDYLLPVAAKAIEEADCLVGARRLLDEFRNPGQEEFEYRGNLEEVLDFLDKAPGQDRRIAVLVSGDPGFHSLLGPVSRRFDTTDYRVIPGISSYQAAMACRGKPWQGDLLLSCHGRDFSDISSKVREALAAGRRVILLTDPKRSPEILARELLSAGCDASPRVWLAADMARPGESFRGMSLAELAAAEIGEYRLCVMIIEK